MLFAQTPLIDTRMDTMNYDEFEKYWKSMNFSIWHIPDGLDEANLTYELHSPAKTDEVVLYYSMCKCIGRSDDDIDGIIMSDQVLRNMDLHLLVRFVEHPYSLYEDTANKVSVLLAQLNESMPIWKDFTIHPGLIRFIEVLVDRSYENAIRMIYDVIIFKARRYRKIVTSVSFSDLITYIRAITPEEVNAWYRNPSIGSRLLDLQDFPNIIDAWNDAPLGIGYNTYQFIWEDIYHISK